MNINIIGAGPSGLYFSILMKKSNPAHDITIYEQNRADDTFGFGVVFSDETLGNFHAADAPSHDEIIENFAYWSEIDTWFKGTMVRSDGHGFCGISRHVLLDILQRRAMELGVTIKFMDRVNDVEALRDADLVLGTDGVNSVVRELYKNELGATVSFRPNKFSWMGSTAPMKAFTFIFEENEHGPWIVHGYRFLGNKATWVMETTEKAWLAAGLDKADEAQSAAYLEKVFAKHLHGHKLLTNRSLWRNFPIVKCKTYVNGNVVILGDAAHTAHFSIGSGTKLAIEDAIELHRCFQTVGDNVPKALAMYDTERRTGVEKIQHAAETSLVWFENIDRGLKMDPVQFAFSMLTRSKQITYDNLKLRDASFVDKVDRWFAGTIKAKGFDIPQDNPPPPMFTPFRLRDMVVQNRVVVSPMCQYSAVDGMPNDWHLVHLGSRSIGGAGLIFTEMTDISAEARISPGCTGIWNDAQTQAWKKVVDFVHANGVAKICMQLGHAGRKGSTQLGWQESDAPLPLGNWPIIAPSPIPYTPANQTPREMTRADMDKATAEFVAATKRAEQAGFDMLEVHMAHGYLLATFLSPLTNRRTDEYGGSLAKRLRWPLEVFKACRAAWPKGKPMSVRLSAVDWAPGGMTVEDSIEIAKALKAADCDLIDVSTGQTVADQKPVYGRMYQTPFAEAIRNEVEIATMAVGNIVNADQVNTIVASGRADVVALARPHLADPYFTLHAAAEYGYALQRWPDQYLSGRDQAYGQAQRAREEREALRKAQKPRSVMQGKLAAE